MFYHWQEGFDPIFRHYQWKYVMSCTKKSILQKMVSIKLLLYMSPKGFAFSQSNPLIPTADHTFGNVTLSTFSLT